jgi:putative intracellular protease/amidase
MTVPLKALVVATSHARLGATGEPTGFYWEELATPYYAFLDQGFATEIASIAGGRPPADPKSEPQEGQHVAAVDRFLADREAMERLAATRPIDRAADVYDIVFLAGGHGAMWDMPENAALSALLSDVFARGGVVGAVCHGPAGLIGATAADGNPLVAGRRVAGFTDEEERLMKLESTVPFLLETRLRELGAIFEPGPPFTPKAVRDGRLVTGQNPMSSEETAKLAIEAARDPVAR